MSDFKVGDRVVVLLKEEERRNRAYYPWHKKTATIHDLETRTLFFDELITASWGRTSKEWSGFREAEFILEEIYNSPLYKALS